MKSLRRAADSDGLTEQANQRRLDRALGEEWRRASRIGASLSSLLVDVDRFKAYNDRHGHPEGDACLRFRRHDQRRLRYRGPGTGRAGGAGGPR